MFRVLSRSACLATLLAILVVPWTFIGQAAAQATEPAATRPAPSTAASEMARILGILQPDIAEVVHRVNAGDRSVAPTILLWLGSEQDGRRVGRGWSRMLVAFRAVSRLQMKEAVPWLITIYDNPTADALARNMAAETAIRLDPYYSVAFLREVLDDASLRSIDPAQPLPTARCEAAVALATIGDEDARAMLIDAMIGYLDSLNRGGSQYGLQAQNWRVCVAVSRCADAELARRFAELKPHYPNQPARGRLNGMIEQIQVNALAVDALLKLLHSADAAPPLRRVEATIALGAKAGPEVLPELRAVQREVAARQAAAGVDATQPGTAPATQPIVATTAPGKTAPGRAGSSNSAEVATTRETELLDPSTRPATTRPSGASDAELAEVCREAINTIESRNPVPVSDDGAPPVAATQPFALPGQEAVGDDAELLWLESVTTRQVHNVKTPVAVFYDPAGLLPPIQTVVKNTALPGRLREMPYGLLARIQLADGGAELAALRFQPIAPGELAPGGHVLIARRTIRDGQWELEAVVLRRFGRETTALLPNRRRAGGQFRPDSRMARALALMTVGQPVVATFEPGDRPVMLRSFAPYRPPIAARIVKFIDTPTPEAGAAVDVGAALPRVELEIARHRKTYLLPADDTPYATLSNDTVRALPVGADVKVIADDAADPPALLAVQLNGGVARRADGSMLGGRGAGVAFSATRSSDYRASSFRLLGHEQFKAASLRAGVAKLLQATTRPNGLDDAKMAELKRISQNGTPIFVPEDVQALNGLAARWAAAGDADQAEVGQEIVLRLTSMSAKLARDADAQAVRFRALLTAAQYRQALVLGGWKPPELRPPPAPRPTTWP